MDNDLHVRAIDRLVHELGISAEEVNRMYREVLEELKKDIKVKAFLPILASRGVKERLLQQR
jgi:transcription initiation factor TFIIIB Brf1 subunit/transcription initiation factor TFIIB